MLKAASPIHYIPRSDLTVVHEIRRRIRVRAKFLKHPLLNKEFLSAHLSLIPGVQNVRINTYAGSLIVEHNGVTDLLDKLRTAIAQVPPHGFDPVASPVREPIRKSDVIKHLAVAAIAPHVPLLIQIHLVGLVAIPVILDSIKSFFSNGISAKSLDGVSTGLCLVLRNFTAASIIAFMRILGDYLRQQNESRSNELLKSLLHVKQETAWVERNGVEIELTIEEVVHGDIIVCGCGDLVAVDGTVTSGSALVNNSLITGESLPVYIGTGDSVVSGSVVENGNLKILAHKVGAESSMGKVHKFLEDSLQDKSLPQLRGDQLGDTLAPVTLGLGTGAFALTGDLARAASVSSIDYVCSVKFPAHFSVKSSMAAAGRSGMLLRGGQALDSLARADTVVFDKTGTLTANQMRVTDIIPTKDWSAKEVLTLAASMEQHYKHPVARTILAEAKEQRIHLTPAGSVDFYVSHGICAMVDGKRAQIGSRRFISGVKGLACDHVDEQADLLRNQGKMVLYVAQNNEIKGLIALQDIVRPTAQETISVLRRLGVSNIIVLTGDHPKTAAHLTKQLEGIDAIHSELTPEDKVRVIAGLKKQGRNIVFVGDGVNDAPAFTHADLGICMAHSGDLAQVSAQAVMLNEDLRSICSARKIAMRQHQLLDRCLYQGVVVNTLLLGFATFGMLAPVSAALLHNLNTFSLLGYTTYKAGAPVNIPSLADVNN